MGTTFEAETRGTEPERLRRLGDELDDVEGESLRLGQDVRFVLAAVGGGAIRIGREIARRHLRHLETIAINCDGRVQGHDDFDRRVCLGWDGSPDETHGSPAIGAQHARTAEPALDRLFENATFVTVVASLGGGTGTGALPFVLEAAARHSEFLTAFVIKPFAAEGDRRATADRALGRLHFVDSFVEKQQQGTAKIKILDNESYARDHRKAPFFRLNVEWARLIISYIEEHYLAPVEAAVEARRLAGLVASDALSPPRPEIARPLEVAAPLAGLPRLLVPPLAAAPALAGAPPDVELTFEVVPPRGTLLQ